MQKHFADGEKQRPCQSGEGEVSKLAHSGTTQQCMFALANAGRVRDATSAPVGDYP